MKKLKDLTRDRAVVITLSIIFGVTFFAGLRWIALAVAIIMMGLFLREILDPTDYSK